MKQIKFYNYLSFRNTNNILILSTEYSLIEKVNKTLSDELALGFNIVRDNLEDKQIAMVQEITGELRNGKN